MSPWTTMDQELYLNGHSCVGNKHLPSAKILCCTPFHTSGEKWTQLQISNNFIDYVNDLGSFLTGYKKTLHTQCQFSGTNAIKGCLSAILYTPVLLKMIMYPRWKVQVISFLAIYSLYGPIDSKTTLRGREKVKMIKNSMSQQRVFCFTGFYIK